MSSGLERIVVLDPQGNILPINQTSIPTASIFCPVTTPAFGKDGNSAFFPARISPSQEMKIVKLNLSLDTVWIRPFPLLQSGTLDQVHEIKTTPDGNLAVLTTIQDSFGWNPCIVILDTGGNLVDEQVIVIHNYPVQPQQFQIGARQFFILPDSGFFVAYHFYFIGPPDEYRGAWLDKNLNKYREELLITNEGQNQLKVFNRVFLSRDLVSFYVQTYGHVFPNNFYSEYLLKQDTGSFPEIWKVPGWGKGLYDRSGKLRWVDDYTINPVKIFSIDEQNGARTDSILLYPPSGLSGSVHSFRYTSDSCFLITGENEQPGLHNSEYYVIKTDTAGNIPTRRQEDVKLSGIRLFPNPASDNVSLSGLPQQGAEVIVFSEDGKELSGLKANAETVVLDIRAVKTGIFFVQVSDIGGNIKVLKGMKQDEIR